MFFWPSDRQTDKLILFRKTLLSVEGIISKLSVKDLQEKRGWLFTLMEQRMYSTTSETFLFFIEETSLWIRHLWQHRIPKLGLRNSHQCRCLRTISIERFGQSDVCALSDDGNEYSLTREIYLSWIQLEWWFELKRNIDMSSMRKEKFIEMSLHWIYRKRIEILEILSMSLKDPLVHRTIFVVIQHWLVKLFTPLKVLPKVRCGYCQRCHRIHLQSRTSCQMSNHHCWSKSNRFHHVRTLHYLHPKQHRFSLLFQRNVPRQMDETTQHPFIIPFHGSPTPSYGAYGSRTPMHDESRTSHDENMVQWHLMLMSRASARDPTSITTPRYVCVPAHLSFLFSSVQMFLYLVLIMSMMMVHSRPSTLNPTTSSSSHLNDLLAGGFANSSSSNSTGSNSMLNIHFLGLIDEHFFSLFQSSSTDHCLSEYHFTDRRSSSTIIVIHLDRQSFQQSLIPKWNLQLNLFPRADEKNSSTGESCQKVIFLIMEQA